MGQNEFGYVANRDVCGCIEGEQVDGGGEDSVQVEKGLSKGNKMIPSDSDLFKEHFVPIGGGPLSANDSN